MCAGAGVREITARARVGIRRRCVRARPERFVRIRAAGDVVCGTRDAVLGRCASIRATRGLKLKRPADASSDPWIEGFTGHRVFERMVRKNAKFRTCSKDHFSLPHLNAVGHGPRIFTIRDTGRFRSKRRVNRRAWSRDRGLVECPQRCKIVDEIPIFEARGTTSHGRGPMRAAREPRKPSKGCVASAPWNASRDRHDDRARSPRRSHSSQTRSRPIPTTIALDRHGHGVRTPRRSWWSGVERPRE